MQKVAQFENKLQELQNKYKHQLPDRIRAITEDWDKLCDVTWNIKLLDRLIARIHSISGSAGSFGFSQLSRECQTAETILLELRQQQSLPSLATKRTISKIIEELYEHSGLEHDAPLIVEKDTSANLKLLIVDDETEYAQLVSIICEQWGYNTEILTDLTELASQLATSKPDAVLIDIIFPEGSFAGINAVKKIHDSLGLRIPVIFMSSRNDLDARLKAMRAGGEAYLTKPVDPVELKTILDRIKVQKTNYASVLIVDDEKSLTRAYAYMLEDYGFEVFICNDPTDVIRQVEKHAPNLVLLDLNMPKIKGDELLRLFKQDPKFMHIPIVMMTADGRDQTKTGALQAGATDFIAKPFDAETLTAKVRSVIVRANAMQQLIKQVTRNDLQKNISNRQHFMGVLQEILHDGDIEGQPAVLVQLTTRNLEYLRHKVGLSRMEQTNHQLINWVKAKLQPGELMTEVADLSVLILMKTPSRETITKRLTSLITHINEKTFNATEETISLDCCCALYHLSRTNRHIDDILNDLESGAFNATTTPSENIIICREGKENTVSTAHDHDIEQAVENLEVNLIYQPIINMESQKKTYEAYARINDSQGAPLPPAEFMGHIENRNFQNEFNQALAYAAIQALDQQAQQGVRDLSLIIKPATRDLNPLPFLAWMSKMLDRTPILPDHKLLMAIPEEYLLQQRRAALKLITGIRDLSCGLMLDHSGLNARSAEIFSELKPDLVKLNRTVIDDIMRCSTESRQNVETLVNSGATVIAPYVESATCFANLWDLGIRHFQGFFVQAPKPSLDFDFSDQS